MNILIILTDILFIIFIGYLLGELFLFHNSYSQLKKISLSYAIGFGLIGIQLFIYFNLKIQWSLLTIFFPWFILLIFYLMKRGIKKVKFNLFSIFSQFKELSYFKIVLISLILLLFLFVFIESIIRPVQAWDGWDNWILRSNVFYIKQGIDPYYFKYTSDEYPLIIPLTVTFGYITLGKIDDLSILLFYYLFYFSLGLIFYTEANRFTGQKGALIFTFLLLSTQNIIRHGGRYEAGQADLAIGFYIFTSAIILYDFLKYNSNKTLLLLSLILGITSQVKNDSLPFVFLSILIVLFNIYRSKKFSSLLYILPFPIILLTWIIFKDLNNLSTNYLFQNKLIIHFDRIPVVLGAMIQEFFNIQNWNLLWIIFLFCIIVFNFRIKKYGLFILIILAQWSSYAGVFLITPVDPATQINAVINKLYLHISPLAFLIIAIYASKIYTEHKRKIV